MLIEYLQKEFSARRKRNPRYSLRAFAKSLQLDSSTLSKLLRKKRPLTLNLARALLRGLELDEAKKKEIFYSTFLH